MLKLMDEVKPFDIYMQNKHLLATNKRGNMQVQFGLACSENVGPYKNENTVLSQYGSTGPRLTAPSTDENGRVKDFVKSLLARGTDLGEILKVDFCQKSYGRHDLDHGKLVDYLHERLEMPGVPGQYLSRLVYSACTLFAYKLGQQEGGELLYHQDMHNDPGLPAVIGASETGFDHDLGCWVRAGLIWQTRISVRQALLRGVACRHFASITSTTLDKWSETEPHRLPGYPVDRYFRDGVGSDGIILTVDTHNNDRIVGLALVCPASGNKQGNFISTISSSIQLLRRFHKFENQDLLTEVPELLCLSSYLPGTYGLACVLGQMQTDWDREASHLDKGSLVSYVAERIKSFNNGSLSGGAGRRCQPFMTKKIPVEHAHTNVSFFANGILKHAQMNPESFPKGEPGRRRMYQDIIKSAQKSTMEVLSLSSMRSTPQLQ